MAESALTQEHRPTMDLGLKDRVVLVTGSSRGIGRATAILFGQEQARVAITYVRERVKAEAVVGEIRWNGSEAYALKLDLTSMKSIKSAVAAVVRRWGRVDVLVNNAVQWGTRPPWKAPLFEQWPPDEWKASLRANTEGPYAAIQAVLPSMRKQKWGRIINISSGVAVDGLPGSGPYAAAKAALHGLARTLAKELGPAGILVNVVMPGLTLTERNATQISEAAKAQMAKASPIRRLLPPEEVVPTIVFLCSAMNTAVTGEIIRASGGIT
jgi:NAD(P)-dependent dehydrogenase (short-subunit alcohol dehydrogenase family)